MAAIFCLLAYYHTIGKRAGENALREKYLGPFQIDFPLRILYHKYYSITFRKGGVGKWNYKF